MAAKDEGRDIFLRGFERFREEVAEARRIQHARHADDFFRVEAGFLLHHPHHRVERVGDDDDERVRAEFFQVLRHRRNDAGVGGDEVVAAHAGLARDPGGDDHHIRAFEVLVIIRAFDGSIDAFDRTGLRNVERFALRQAFDHVEQHHIAEFFVHCQMRQRAADIACADETDFFPCCHDALHKVR